jgi:hypothetical protein
MVLTIYDEDVQVAEHAIPTVLHPVLGELAAGMTRDALPQPVRRDVPAVTAPCT